MLPNPALSRQLLTTHDAPIFDGPFGPRRIVYADFTASGRGVAAVERAMARHVLPLYGNTHTEASHTGGSTTRLREEARQAIRRGVNAGEQHAVIFCGSGSTAAVNKLVAMMGLALPLGARERAIVEAAVPEAERPVVFVGPFEHHSNELPWRESLATVVRLPLDGAGRPCLETLARVLVEYADRPQRIVTLSAASNVTGVVTDIKAAARLVHAHGGRLFVDFAAGAPYLEIDMAGRGDGDHIDAAFLSPHKFAGGPGASGVLIADRTLHRAERPTLPGGGTVQFVTPTAHRYVSDIEALEEAGTPAILGDIRAGLAMQLKSDIGVETIHAAEQRAIARATARWAEEPGIELLGPTEGDRLAIFSLNVRSGNRMLHHGLVVRLLNDLFGIQARGGCSCAGPYGHDLLGIGADRSGQYQCAVLDGHELFKPGWVRVGLHYTFDEATIDAIIEAVAFVARRGHALLPLYEPSLASGRWLSAGGEPQPKSAWDELCAEWRGGAAPATNLDTAPDLATCFKLAEELADRAERMHVEMATMPAGTDHLRWFWLPGERVAA